MSLHLTPRLLLRPGGSDLCLALLLVVGAGLGGLLEPSHLGFWMTALLPLAAVLFVAGMSALSSRRVLWFGAALIHGLLVIACMIGVLYGILLFVSIILIGLALIIWMVATLLAVNSVLTLYRVIRMIRGR